VGDGGEPELEVACLGSGGWTIVLRDGYDDDEDGDEDGCKAGPSQPTDLGSDVSETPV
jgi:hypothetical protein